MLLSLLLLAVVLLLLLLKLLLSLPLLVLLLLALLLKLYLVLLCTREHWFRMDAFEDARFEEAVEFARGDAESQTSGFVRDDASDGRVDQVPLALERCRQHRLFAFVSDSEAEPARTARPLRKQSPGLLHHVLGEKRQRQRVC